MTLAIIIGVAVVWIAAAVLVLALCRMLAISDRQMVRERPPGAAAMNHDAPRPTPEREAARRRGDEAMRR